MSTYDDDDALQQALAEALAEGEQTPPGFARAGRELFTWRTFEAELAELVADSRDEPSEVLVRGDQPDRRSLSFRTARWTVELDLERDPSALRGQLVADSSDAVMPTEAVLERVDHPPTTVAVDDLGYFAVEPFAPGSVRFRLRFPLPGGDVVTAWVTP
jgi:hypothetical protein